jgi:hypothetical protein
MVDIVLKALLLLSPIVYGFDVSLNRLDTIFFHVGSIVLFGASLFDKQKRSSDILHIPIISLLGLCLVSLFWHGFKPIHLSYFLTVFLACLSIITVVRYCKSPSECSKFIVYAVIINIVVYLFQMFGFNPILDNSPTDEFGGILGNAPRLLTYIAIVLPFIFNVSLWLFLSCLALGLIGKELGVLLIGLIIIFVKSKYNWQKIVLFLISLIGVVVLKDEIYTSLLVRIKAVWGPSITLFFKRPLLGFGLGACSDVFGIFSSYIQFVFNVGIMGALWIGYVVSRAKGIIKGNYDNIEVLTFVSLLVMALFEYPFEIPRLWFTIVAIISFFVIKNTKEAVNAG